MRLLYILAEIGFLWLVLMAGSAFLVGGAFGFGELGQLILLILTPVMLFGAAKLVLIGGDLRDVWTRRYRPIRLLSMISTAAGAFRGESTLPVYGHRRVFAFDFSGPPSVSAYDVIDRLSEELNGRGIRHSKAGGILVDNNGTRWWLEPELGANRVTGWVESEEDSNREQIIGALRQFLSRDMGLRLA
jgi:hypothetical protein